ncbi:MAG: hypothetical protein KA229_11175 [Chitinophagaceae bacterium]|nr:hypothetical protein [Chitinophagaceae bacterium]
MTDSGIIRKKTLYPLWIYVIACFLPVFKADNTPGISALLMGWMGLLGHSAVFFSWLANIFFFAAYLIPSRKRTERIVFSLLSVLFGLTFLTVKEIPESEGGQMMLTTPGVAFWFWISSFLMLLFSIIIYPPDKT